MIDIEKAVEYLLRGKCVNGLMNQGKVVNLPLKDKEFKRWLKDNSLLKKSFKTS